MITIPRWVIRSAKWRLPAASAICRWNWKSGLTASPASSTLRAKASRARRISMRWVFAAALGGKRGRLGLDRDPQLEHRDQLLDRRELRRVDAERPVRSALEDERADTLSRVDQAARLEPRDRFPHYGPADAVGGHDLGLGGQLVAGPQLALADARGHAVDQHAGQAAAAPGRGRFRRRGALRPWCGRKGCLTPSLAGTLVMVVRCTITCAPRRTQTGQRRIVRPARRRALAATPTGGENDP